MINYSSSIKSFYYLIDLHDVISFDIFDTLLDRKVARPDDVFKYIERAYNIEGFASKRVEAELVARQENKDMLGVQEVTLEDIYSVYPENDQDPSKLIDLEIKVEGMLLEKNRFFFDLYKYAKKQRKRVVAISDMYLNKLRINELLTDNSIFVDEIYVSSEYLSDDLGKYNGKMYPFVLEAEGIKSEQMVHFGDNEVSDFQNAISSNVCAVHHPAILTDLFTWSRINNHSVYLVDKYRNLESGIIVGALAKRFADSPAQTNYSDRYMFGYFYGGVLVASFCKYLVESACSENVSRLLLLARDGYVVEQALDILDVKEIEYEVLPASRRMMIFPLLAYNCKWAEGILFPKHVEYSASKDLERLGFNIDDFIHTMPVEELRSREKFLDDYFSFLQDKAQVEHDNVVGYLKKIIGNSNSDEFAIVDVGWGLSTQKAMDTLLDDKIKGYYIGTHDKAYDNGRTSSFLFDKGEPQELCHSIMGAVELIELIFSDPACSVVCPVKKLGEYNINYYNKSNLEKIRDSYIKDIRQGVNDFLNDIRPHFRHMNKDSLKDICSDLIKNVSINPTPEEYSSIGNIAHPREIGQAEYRPISYWWKVSSNIEREKINKSIEKKRKITLQKKLHRETIRIVNQAQSLFGEKR